MADFLDYYSPSVTAKILDSRTDTVRRMRAISTPAAIIGPSSKGPAFVPLSTSDIKMFTASFGPVHKGPNFFGPIAAAEFLEGSRDSSVNYTRVLGAGNCKKRNADGSVTNAGFVVGDELPQSNGLKGKNSQAIPGSRAVAAQAVIQVGTPANSENFTLKDTSGSTQVFIFDTSSNVFDGSRDGSNRVIIGIAAVSASADGITTRVISAIEAARAAGFIKISAEAFGSTTTRIQLRQIDKGTSGNRPINFGSAQGLKVLNAFGTPVASGNFSFGAANVPAPPGRTYFLGCFMTGSPGSPIFDEAGIVTSRLRPSRSKLVPSGAPIIRGILMAPSGVLISLSSSLNTNNTVSTTRGVSGAFGANADAGYQLGDVEQLSQNFTILLNGFKSTSGEPNQYEVSFDPQGLFNRTPNYFAKVLNRDPTKIEEYGHYLYTHYDVFPQIAHVACHKDVTTFNRRHHHSGSLAAFILTSSLGRNMGSATTSDFVGVPNFENFSDRFSHAKSPFITSQGEKPEDLFRLHAVSDGPLFHETDFRHQCHLNVIISNIEPPTDNNGKYDPTGYPSFDVVVSNSLNADIVASKAGIFGDTNQITYSRVNLNPSSEDFIARRIGDLHEHYDFEEQVLRKDGLYQLRSSTDRDYLVRVEVSKNVQDGSAAPSLMPFGFRGLPHIMLSGSTSSSSGILSPGKINNTGIPERVFREIKELPIPMRLHGLGGDMANAFSSTKFLFGVQSSSRVNLHNPNRAYFGHHIPQDPEAFDEDDPSGVPKHPLAGDVLYERPEALKFGGAYTAYFPSFRKDIQNFQSNDVKSSIAGAVFNSDDYNNNYFSLGKIQVITGSDGLADSEHAGVMTYSRNGLLSKKIPTRIDTVGNNPQPSHLHKECRFLEPKDFTVSTVRNNTGFTAPFYGGFSGYNIFNLDSCLMNNDSIERELLDSKQGGKFGNITSAYKKAIEIIEEPSYSDFDLFAMPGIRNRHVTNRAIDMVDEVKNCIYLMDIQEFDSLNNIVTGSYSIANSKPVHIKNTANELKYRAVNSPGVVAYFPDVNINRFPDRPVFSPKNGIKVPPSVMLLGVYSRAGKFLSPMGTSRGQLTAERVISLDKTVAQRSDEAALFRAKINPIMATADGVNHPIYVKGQNTLQNSDSGPKSLVRIMRTILFVKRVVKNASLSLLFDPSNERQVQISKSVIEDKLSSLVRAGVITDFNLRLDGDSGSKRNIDKAIAAADNSLDEFELQVMRGEVEIQVPEREGLIVVDLSSEI